MGSGSLLVLSVSVVGILFTSILLLAYYLFLACSSPLPSFFADQPRRGLEEATIRRIPTLRYHHQQQQQQQQCGVCLGDFREGERLRRLPPCLHSFHIDCIDAWLAAALTCPLCRAHVTTRQPDQPMRRSLSLDSCTIILHPQGSKPFFSFGHARTSPTPILPI
uniref:RING-type E3 ubiquitin transferase n=1 Tax=Oryza punctata TaxID=4537 RepID=A0A0E0LY14_ORYPU